MKKSYRAITATATLADEHLKTLRQAPAKRRNLTRHEDREVREAHAKSVSVVELLEPSE